MISAWTKHLSDPKDKEDFEKEIRGARRVLDRLFDLMKEDETGLSKAETSQKAYDSPNWDYRQADSNGYRRCLMTYQNLLILDRKD